MKYSNFRWRPGFSDRDIATLIVDSLAWIIADVYEGYGTLSEPVPEDGFKIVATSRERRRVAVTCKPLPAAGEFQFVDAAKLLEVMWKFSKNFGVLPDMKQELQEGNIPYGYCSYVSNEDDERPLEGVGASAVLANSSASLTS